MELSSHEELLAALERERAPLMALLQRLDEAQWRATREDGWTVHDIAMHLADSNYGMARLVLGEIQPALPLNEATGWMEVDELNQQRRLKNAALPREKVLSRLESAFAQARHAIEATPDLEAPGPYGPIHTQGYWLRRIVEHTRMHSADIERLLGRA